MRHLFTAIAAATLLAAPALAQGAPPAPVAAPAGAYVSDKTHTTVEWQGLHNGLSWYSARFTDFDIQLTFDPADVTKSKVTATIDPKSIETDYTRTRPAGNTTDFNNELATDARFFNAGKFPKITFTSTAVTKTGEKTGKVTGNLTFLGVTKPVTLNIVCFRHRGTANGDSDAFNGEIVADLHESGIAAPSTTTIGGRLAIRAAIVNHRTRAEDIDALLAGVLRFGAARLS